METHHIWTNCDIPSVSQILPSVQNSSEAYIILNSNLTVSSKIQFGTFRVKSNQDNSNYSISLTGTSTLDITRHFSLRHVVLYLGDANNHAVTTNINFDNLTDDVLDGGIISNSGTLTFTGDKLYKDTTITSSQAANTITNLPGGVLNINNIAIKCEGNLSNYGEMNFKNPAGIVIVPAFTNFTGITRIDTAGVDFKSGAEQYSGTFLLRSGTARVSTNVPVPALWIHSGTLAGEGTIDATLYTGYEQEPYNSLSYPVISPGIDNDQKKIGTMNVTGFFKAFSPNTSFQMDVDDAGNFDKLAIVGSAQLAGILNVNASMMYTPATGTRLSLITTGDTFTGAFSTVNVNPNGFTWQGGRHWKFDQQSGSCDIVVEQGSCGH